MMPCWSDAWLWLWSWIWSATLAPAARFPSLGETATPACSVGTPNSTCHRTRCGPVFANTATWVCWPSPQPSCTLVGVTRSQPEAGVGLGLLRATLGTEAPGVDWAAGLRSEKTPARARSSGHRRPRRSTLAPRLTARSTARPSQAEERWGGCARPPAGGEGGAPPGAWAPVGDPASYGTGRLSSRTRSPLHVPSRPLTSPHLPSRPLTSLHAL